MAVLFLLLLPTVVLAQWNITIVPNEDCGSNGTCTTFDQALQQLATNELSSSTTLTLTTGTHFIETLSTIQNVADVRIVGADDPSRVIVTCADGIGLGFLNVSGLEISHMTIEWCGLNNSSWIFSKVETFIDTFYVPPPVFSSALILISCTDVQMNDVTVKNNIGFGMFALNVIGNSTFSGINFISNVPSNCVVNVAEFANPGGAGGGAFFLYSDYQEGYKPDINQTFLTIKDSKVENNYACRVDLFALLYSMLSKSISPESQLDFNITGAGGISVILSQGSYHVNILVQSCLFRNNSSTYNGAALKIGQFENTDDCHVYVKDCVFIGNGGGLIPRYGLARGLDPAGAVLAIFYGRIPPERITVDVAAGFIQHKPSTIQTINCTFIGNRAHSGGALAVISFGPNIGFVQDRMLIKNCTFLENSAVYGSAVYVAELSYSGFEPGLLVHFEDVHTLNNTPFQLTTVETGVIDINLMEVFFNGSNSFTGNLETPLAAYSSIIRVSGSIIFEHNIGFTGGAMRLSKESYLLLIGDATVLMLENTGQIAGGGIYVDFQLNGGQNYYDCFLFFEEIDHYCDLYNACNVTDYRASLLFINNSAPFGSAIYGSAFVSCPWGEKILTRISDQLTDHDVSTSIFFLNHLDPLIVFSPKIEQGNNVINTDARSILTNDALDINPEYNIMPGQEFRVTLGAFDQLRQPVPLSIFSQLSELEGANRQGAHASIGETDSYLLTGGGATPFADVPVTVFGNGNQSFNVTIASGEGSLQVQFKLLVHLTKCEKGFLFNQELHECVCIVNETLQNVQCQSDGSITYPANAWIGQDSKGDFIIHSCIQDYCEAMVTDLNLSTPDEQCTNHRSGILCGGCQEGYSRVLGSSRCMVCTNNGYLALIIVFALAGVLLVVAISFFKITITDGYINGFIFYSNIVSVYISDYLPPVSQDSMGAPIHFVTAFLNLDLGIETCFFDGLKQVDAVGLEFVFPFYLALLLLVITLCARSCWSRIRFFKDFNAAQVFATLLLLSYTSILRTCIEVLGFVTISAPSQTYIKWLEDPNVTYFHTGTHIILGIFSILFLIILIPIPFLLLFPHLLFFKVKRLAKLKPLIDAFVAPFESHRRYWLGFRLICRLILFCVAYLGSQDHQILTLTLILAVLIMLQAYLKPFSTTSRNLLDLSLLLNLTLLSIVALFLRPKNLTFDKDIQYVTIGFISVFCAELLLLIAYYVVMTFSVTRNAAEKGKTHLKEAWDSMVSRGKGIVPTSEVNPTDSQLQTHNSVYFNASEFDTEETIHFRESLLD